jgi:uncharacterized membrane protein YfcA
MLLWVVSSGSCVSNSDCSHSNLCISGSCSHKALLPINGFDVLGELCVVMISALANASGLGGGALMTITLLVVFNFPLGALLRIRLRHPFRDRPAIDYELLLLTITPLLLGTNVGVFLEMIFPAWTILGILTLLLGWITFEGARASYKAFSIENKERGKQLKADSINSEEHLNVTYVTSDLIALPLKKILDTEKKIAPPIIVILMLLIYLYNVLASLIRGTAYFTSIASIEHCSSTYYFVTLGFFLFAILLTLIISIYLHKRTREKINVGYNFDDYDMIWKFWPSLLCSFGALVSGLSAGLLSVGGGMVMSPIMYRLGLRPQVVVPTSSMLFLLTSSLAVVLQVISGQVLYDYALWVGAGALLGSALGILGIKKLVEKYERASFMVIAMTILLGLSCVIIPSYGIVHYLDSLGQEIVQGYCDKTDFA